MIQLRNCTVYLYFTRFLPWLVFITAPPLPHSSAYPVGGAYRTNPIVTVPQILTWGVTGALLLAPAWSAHTWPDCQESEISPGARRYRAPPLVWPIPWSCCPARYTVHCTVARRPGTLCTVPGCQVHCALYRDWFQPPGRWCVSTDAAIWNIIDGALTQADWG